MPIIDVLSKNIDDGIRESNKKTTVVKHSNRKSSRQGNTVRDGFRKRDIPRNSAELIADSNGLLESVEEHLYECRADAHWAWHAEGERAWAHLCEDGGVARDPYRPPLDKTVSIAGFSTEPPHRRLHIDA